MKFILLFTPALLFLLSLRAQPIEVKMDPCELASNHVPDTLGYTPLKRVRLVLHIFAKADSSGNFRDTPEDREFIQQVVNHANWPYTDPEPMKNPAPEYYFMQQPRILLVMDTLLFHYDDDAWNFRKYVTYFEKKTGDSTGYSFFAVRSRCNELHKKYVQENELLSPRHRDSALHVFFLECGPHRGKGMAEGLGSKKWAYLAGAWQLYLEDKIHWVPGMVMGHEIGHSLGLSHPYDYSGCDDLPMSERGATNNFMDTYPNAGRGVTPCQLGQMHKNLLEPMMAGSDIHHTLIKDWCRYHPDATMTIRAGDTVYWDSPHYLWGDLVVESGATLVVRCELSMPPGARIRVRENGALILDRGIITQNCVGTWAGVELQSREKLFGIFRRKSLALFEIRNGGRVERTENEVKQAEF